MQSYKIVFVAPACNIQCILHQRQELSNENSKRCTNEKSSYLTNCLAMCTVEGTVGRLALFIGPRNTCCCGPCLLRRLRGITNILNIDCLTLTRH